MAAIIEKFAHSRLVPLLILAGVLSLVWAFGIAPAAAISPACWRREWPKTDFSKHSSTLARSKGLWKIFPGGARKDGIPSIDDPSLLPVSEVTDLAGTEPVIGLFVHGDARAYPLRILNRHEIVNDVVGHVPVAVTYCPLCDSAIVFKREVAGRVLDFGTSGKLHNSNLIMYDRQTESWWQQFIGEAIVGEMTGTRLNVMPARLESFALFRERHPGGTMLVPTDPHKRKYGTNPYPGYDTARVPFLYFGGFPKGIRPLARVVKVGEEAWSLALLRRKGRIEAGELVLTWKPGRNSALDTKAIREGRDVGNIVVQRRTERGLEDIVHGLTFAFVFHAFHPDGTLHLE